MATPELTELLRLIGDMFRRCADEKIRLTLSIRPEGTEITTEPAEPAAPAWPSWPQGFGSSSLAAAQTGLAFGDGFRQGADLDEGTRAAAQDDTADEMAQVIDELYIMSERCIFRAAETYGDKAAKLTEEAAILDKAADYIKQLREITAGGSAG